MAKLQENANFGGEIYASVSMVARSTSQVNTTMANEWIKMTHVCG